MNLLLQLKYIVKHHIIKLIIIIVNFIPIKFGNKLQKREKKKKKSYLLLGHPPTVFSFIPFSLTLFSQVLGLFLG